MTEFEGSYIIVLVVANMTTDEAFASMQRKRTLGDMRVVGQGSGLGTLASIRKRMKSVGAPALERCFADVDAILDGPVDTVATPMIEQDALAFEIGTDLGEWPTAPKYNPRHQYAFMLHRRRR